MARSYASDVSAVTLREVTDGNRHAVLAVRVAPTQKRFVGTVAGALIDAEEIPEGNPWYRAIYADDQPVGFVMLSWNVTPEPPRIIGPWFLWKLLIDERHQRRGFGRETVLLVADIVRRNGAAELLTSCVQGDEGPEAFYRRIGFRLTGERDENGEIILALDLDPRGHSRSR
jgi:diamine N-acetyltransferase